MINCKQMGMMAVRMRDSRAAAQWFEQALQQNPADGEVRAWLGQSLCSIGRHQEGVAHLHQSGKMLLEVAFVRGNAAPVAEVSSQLLHWGSIEMAIELLEEVTRIASPDFRSLQFAGGCLCATQPEKGSAGNGQAGSSGRAWQRDDKGIPG